MQILNSVPFIINPAYAKDQCLHNVYQVSETITNSIKNSFLPGNTVILFSGGFRLDFDGTYIEPKIFKEADLPWQKNTIFIDSDNQQVLEYTLKKLNISNLAIVHSTVFLKYRTLDKIYQDIVRLSNFSKKVLVSMPTTRMDFNRLKYSNQDIADKFNGTLIEDSIIICQ